MVQKAEVVFESMNIDGLRF